MLHISGTDVYTSILCYILYFYMLIIIRYRDIYHNCMILSYSYILLTYVYTLIYCCIIVVGTPHWMAPEILLENPCKDNKFHMYIATITYYT